MWHKKWVILTTCMTCIILLACTTALCGQPQKTIPANKTKTIDITEVVKAIGEALKEAQENNVAIFPPLKSVEINLSTVATKEGGAKFSILIFSTTGGISGEDVSTITLKMEPPTTKTAPRTVDSKKYKMVLAEALNTCKAGIIAAKKSLPQLDISEIDIEVAFTVKENAEGGISVAPIAIGDVAVGGGVNGKLSKSQVHKMKLVFGTGSPK
jgi:hypothetical protein